MANLGFLPKFFSKRAKWFNTPWVAVVFSTAIIVAVSRMDYTDIVAAANFLYSLGMLLEYASFLWCRRTFPTFKRPFQVPGPWPALVFLCLIPSAFLVFLMCIGTKFVYLMTGLMSLCAILLYFLMKLCASKK